MKMLDQSVKEELSARVAKLEVLFDGNVMAYVGQIHPAYLKDFRNFIEHLVSNDKKDRLIINLHTPGGSVEAVEKMVEIVRHHYKEVYFIVPDSAMSAGTIFCMSGDKIFMDYSSSLGPIDPQVLISKDGRDQYVPALGYLDQVEKLIQKSNDGTLSPAEFAILQNQDLGLLRRYEQARDLSVDLLETWLIKYKFKNWKEHKTSPDKLGKKVTVVEKKKRAHEIAKLLGSNKEWHAHGRMIGIGTLSAKLKLEIEDYTGTENQSAIREYNDFLTEYISKQQFPVFMHSKSYF
ncbi:MAG: ATP-dependent Clp protease proteolytic subunit [Mariprofundaceae bacterium]|nr:ATP-dependent Clp protease proteolytic subunit [Mariprofundaceae bacterium]